jgi:ABC-2 type transport system ATP-binding protein
LPGSARSSRSADGSGALVVSAPDAESRTTGEPAPRNLRHKLARRRDRRRSSPGAVVAQGLTKSYRNGVTAAIDVSLDVSAGEVVAILGPNGAGKSTTLNMLATLLSPTQGDARILGHSITDVAAVRPLIGVALQEAGLDPLMSGRAHFDVQGALYRVPQSEIQERVLDLASSFELDSYLERSAGLYSGGTQRRLALALALVHDPPVVIFDEPTAGLDPGSRQSVWDVIAELRARDRAVLFSTHYMEEAEALADRLYLLDQGRVVASGSAGVLKERLGATRLVIRVAGPTSRALKSANTALARAHESRPTRRATSSGPVVGRADRGLIIFDVGNDMVLVERVVSALRRARVPLIEMSLMPPTLNDVFLGLTGHGVTPEPLAHSKIEVMARVQRGGPTSWS